MWATALGAADLGYRTIAIRDALCSASRRGPQALQHALRQHVGTASTEEILERLAF